MMPPSNTPPNIDADLAGEAGEDILYEVRDGIGFLTFNRPQARNAMTFAMYERMAQICADANETRDIRALVLTGAGEKAFAAGTDMSQFRAFDKEEDALAYEARIDRTLGTLERCRIPTIDVAPRAEEIARQISEYAPLTLQATKEAFLRLRTELPPGGGRDLLLMCYMSEDFREGMDAFLSKRPPNFKGQ